MKCQDVYKTAREYHEIYNELQKMGVNGNLRKETAKRLGMSVAQADRYGRFRDLIPDVQNLVSDYGVGMSNLQVIVSHSPSEQKELCEILLEAWAEGVGLTRDFIKRVVDRYREGNKCWSEIKPECLEFVFYKRKPKKDWHKHWGETSLNEIRNLSGTDFELWFAELLRECKYTGVDITQHSYDKGVDVIALKDGVRYIFQCKNTSIVRMQALQEIWFAKRDIDNVPVVVSTGSIAASTRKIAAERGIQCWTGKDIVRLKKDCEGHYEEKSTFFLKRGLIENEEMERKD